MKQSSNPICLNCINAYHRLNGLWCTKLNKLAEYDREPACDWEHFETDSI